MIEIQGPATALADQPLALRARGAGPDAELTWHARMRDDDGLVWRARAERSEDLPGAWRGKADRAALASLRPLRIEVRVESADGQAASRTVTRLLVGEGVRVRRWRDGPVATLHLPAGTPSATLLVDGAAGVAPALLASHGVLAPRRQRAATSTSRASASRRCRALRTSRRWRRRISRCRPVCPAETRRVGVPAGPIVCAGTLIHPAIVARAQMSHTPT